MENASKALIIAGAILLAILIIGLGMFIYQQASGAMSGANLDPQKVAAYNSEFEAYEGTISGTEAKSLCDAIRAHNNANVDDASLNIGVKTTGTLSTAAPANAVDATTVNTVKSSISAGKTYTVTFGYDSKSGYIVDCLIVEKN